MAELPSPYKDFHFLVVDDFESMRVMISAHLMELGATQVSVANSGNEALSFLKASPTKVDFIITDLVMNDGSGVDLLKALRSDPVFRSIPVLIVTSSTDVNSVVDAVRSGANGYVVKPWSLDDLAKKIIKAAPVPKEAES